MRCKVLVILLLSVTASCSKKSDSDNKDDGDGKTEGGDEGTVPGTGALAISATLPEGVDADTAIALNVSGSSVASFAEAATTDITTGQISLNIPAGPSQGSAGLTQDAGSDVANGLIVMTLPAGDDKFEVGAGMKFVEIPASADSNLVKLPTELLGDQTEIDLGVLDGASDSLRAGSINGAELVKTDANTLAQLAATDNGLKLVRNRYMNGDLGAEKYLQVNPQYMFSVDLKPFLTSNDYLSVNFLGADKNASVQGYLLRFDGRFAELTTDDICRASLDSETKPKKELLLTPPQKDLAGNAQKPKLTFNADGCTENDSCPVVEELTSIHVAKSEGSEGSCKGDIDAGDGSYFSFSEQQRDGKKYVNFDWGSGAGYSGAIPAGLWDLNLKSGATSTLIGRFDIGSAYPMSSDATDAYPVIYVPSLKISRDKDNKLTGVDLKFLLWNATTSQYDEVTDITLFGSIVQELVVRVEDHSTGGWDNPDKDGVTFEIAKPASGSVFAVDTGSESRDWILQDTGFKVDNDEKTPHAESFVVSYSMYGVTYRFDFRP